MTEIDNSLRRLGTDYVDLYQIHRWDYETPIEETVEALHDVVKAGKARYIGASSMYAWQFSKALYLADLHGWTRFVSMQNHYNLALPRRRARDDPALPRSGHRRHPVEPARPRPARPGPGTKSTNRSEKDEFGRTLVQRRRPARGRRGRSGRRPARHSAGPGCARLAAGEARHHRARSSARPSPITSTMRSLLSTSISPTDEIELLEKPYQPHTIAGHQ